MSLAPPDLDLGGDFALWELEVDTLECNWPQCSAAATWICRGHFHVMGGPVVDQVVLCDEHADRVRKMIGQIPAFAIVRCGICGHLSGRGLYDWGRL